MKSRIQTEKKKTFVERLKDGYEAAKKPIAYIIMFVAILLQSLPSDLMPKQIQDITYSVMILVLALIIMEMMFTIYEKVTERKLINCSYHRIYSSKLRRAERAVKV